MYLSILRHSDGLRANITKLCCSSIKSSVRWTSSQDSTKKDFSPGDVIHGYKLERVEHIQELNIKPYHLRHEATGAEHLHVQKDGDSNNVFSVSLRTTPKDSCGVAHILEHLALCGSEKYAVRDPFFKMTTRSLATFMNAMTGPDFTVYPFSTQNRKDFENLMSVYTDAVFFPRLRPIDFRQEGWRLEHEKPDKDDTPIVLKGVVYNEMKGVFSSSASIYGRQLLNNVFPDTTYKYESGGDPEHIPNLTHEDLRDFHHLHYHPSNAKFFTYGDIPLEDNLRLINEMVLSKFNANPHAKEASLVKEQQPWTKPRTVDITCPPDPLSASPDKQTTTSVSFMLPVLTSNFEELFALQILSTLLIDGPNAPFYKNLIESGLGSDYSPSTGLGNYTKQPYFSVGLQNILKSDTSKVHEIIEKTFTETAKSGFPQERIEAVLHNIELGLKHISGNFGLRLLMSIESTWNHDGDIIDYFRVNKYVEKFRTALAEDNQFWAKLIEKYFLSNQHKLILNMNPDKEYEDKRNAKERKMIEAKVSKLDDVDRQTVLYEGIELMKIQDSKDDGSVLPCLKPSEDISPNLSYETKLKFETLNGVSTQICEQPTNEVVYFRALVDLGEKLNPDLLPYLPLFCDVATKLGAGAYNRHQFSQKIQLSTGGLGVSLMLNPSLGELDTFKKQVFIGSHCLRKNVDSMFDLWSHVFDQIHFQENKVYLHQLIKATAADLADGISHSGQNYAIKKSSERLTKLASLDEQLSGLTFVARMKDIASKEPVELVVSKLQTIANIAFDPSSMKCALNAEPDAVEHALKRLEILINHAQQKSPSDIGSDTSNNVYDLTRVEELKFPFATHFVAKSLVTVPRLHKDFSKLTIMSKLISSKYLLREIREKGGAYGAGARLSNSGLINFYSYRDPNTDKTMKVFDHAVAWLINGKEYSERDIEESKLGVFQEVDRPVEPGRRGMNFFTLEESDELRQKYRERLLDVKKDDVIHVAKKYLTSTKVGSYII